MNNTINFTDSVLGDAYKYFTSDTSRELALGIGVRNWSTVRTENMETLTEARDHISFTESATDDLHETFLQENMDTTLIAHDHIEALWHAFEYSGEDGDRWTMKSIEWDTSEKLFPLFYVFDDGGLGVKLENGQWDHIGISTSSTTATKQWEMIKYYATGLSEVISEDETPQTITE